MSLDEENRALLVQMELEKAYRTLHVAELLMESQEWSEAAGRTYYALFHAVSALLIKNQIRVKSHKGAYTMLCMHFVATGRVPQEFGNFYREMELMREESDYNCFYNVNSEQIKEHYAKAKEMIDTIAEMVKEGKRDDNNDNEITTRKK